MTRPQAPMMRLRRRRSWLPRSRLSIKVGLGLLLLVILLSALAPTIIGVSSDEFSGDPLESPSGAHLFGTDAYGRDVFVRTFVAARVDFLVAFAGVSVALVVGTALGTFAGVARRPFWGRLLMRVTDAIIAIPFVLLILIVVVGFGVGRQMLGLPRGLVPLLVAMWTFMWAFYARFARAEAMSLRERDYVVAARLMGMRKARVVFRHVLPGVLATVGAYAVGDAVVVVATTGGLAFIGAGILPPTAEWGQMMYEGRGVLQSAWWTVVFPGLVLVLSAIGLALVSDGLLDRLSSEGERGNHR